VKKYTNRGDHLNLESQYNNNGNWVDYGACSSGQKTVLDIHFLQKIVSRLGLLVMDEFLKHLDGNNHDICLDMINGMNIGCIMISSHMESIAAFNNHTIKLELNNAGLTKINYE
jgi:DNA repair exonuclease SbcCD ATPase subunit